VLGIRHGKGWSGSGRIGSNSKVGRKVSSSKVMGMQARREVVGEI
jgi:hypothetical protein